MLKTAALAFAIMAASTEALLDLEVNLPLGISVDLDLFGPKTEPCVECVDLWHPPHGVIIDDCDDTDNGDWHWVHPCPDTHEPEYTWATSTVTATHVSTIIDCPPEVTECPGQSTVYTTVTVPGETTICPVPVTTVTAPPPVVPTTTPVVKPTTDLYYPPTTYPTIPAPPVKTNVPQPPSSPPVVPGPPSTISVGPVPTLSTSVYVPVKPVPTAPVYPPVNTPIAPSVTVPAPGYGGNATAPVSTPPIVTVSPPVPTAGAGQNAQNLGFAVAVGAIAAYVL